MTIYTDYSFHIYHDGVTLDVGAAYLICEHRNELNGAKWYTFNPDISKGVPGNSDPSIRRYHGWRGTTNNVVKNALGVRKIEKITRFGNGTARVKLSEDLHPDWD